ncbi:ATP-binding protein [Patescibacteria group bacterium]|nr:ATP-binding protein [Patescibacteria group bacterium]MBU1921995.1 ATP-binding protein [Patescibacteria group bacterium]
MKTIQTTTGTIIEVDTQDSLWGFKAGDVITSDTPHGSWHQRTVIVEGTAFSPEMQDKVLWGTSPEIGAMHTKIPAHLILLQRPGLDLKVGDKVRSKISYFSGCQGTVIVIKPFEIDAAYNTPYLVKFDIRQGMQPLQLHELHAAQTWHGHPWFPDQYKNPKAKDCYWHGRRELELVQPGPDYLQQPKQETTPNKVDKESNTEPQKKEVMEMKSQMPEWLKQLVLQFKAGIAHFFIVWGNITDLQKNQKGHYVSLVQYLTEVFEQRELIMFYSISAGLEFATKDMEKAFRQRFVTPPNRPGANQTTAAQSAAQGFQRAMADAPLEELIGKSPDRVLPILEKVLAEGADINPEQRTSTADPLLEKAAKEQRKAQASGKKVLVIDFAHNLAPSQTANANAADRVNIETLERWARDRRIKESGNIVILLTPHSASLAEDVRASHSGSSLIRVPKPGEVERTARWMHWINTNGVQIEDGLEPTTLGRITNGLSFRQIDGIYAIAKVEGQPISLNTVKTKKQEIFESEFGDRIKIKVPQFGFRYFGGKDNVKEYLLEVRDNILKGMTRRAPMGILAAGPPGTGKTFMFECWAYECGFNFAEIQNPRVMWVGKSEEMLEKIFCTLDDLSPVIVIEDEADQSETPRDVPNGDSGVSNRLRQMKFQYCSDPKRRGKVIWVRISNRDDLIDAAYKRKGRSDDNIAFVLPDEDECEKIFEVMFARYDIPTDIADFSGFAKTAADKVYCTGADIEWMVLEADKYAGRENTDKVTEQHLNQSIDDWEMDLDPADIDRQTILAIQGSSKRLRPKNWEKTLADAKTRLARHGQAPASVHPDLQIRFTEEN